MTDPSLPPATRREQCTARIFLRRSDDRCNRQRADPAAPPPRLALGGVAGVLLVALAVAGVWAGSRIYSQAMQARSHLLAAMPYVAEVKAAMLASDPEAAATAAAAFRVEAAEAQAAASGRVWDFFESIPLPPLENLRAVSTVADVAVSLADDVLVPASGVSVAALAPSGGKMDVAALRSLSGLLDQIEAGTDAADDRLAALDHGALMDEVRSGVQQVETALAEIQTVSAPARDVVAVLPDALGASGPRNYLVMFQGNAEVRASGAVPARSCSSASTTVPCRSSERRRPLSSTSRSRSPSCPSTQRRKRCTPTSSRGGSRT